MSRSWPGPKSTPAKFGVRNCLPVPPGAVEDEDGVVDAPVRAPAMRSAESLVVDLEVGEALSAVEREVLTTNVAFRPAWGAGAAA